MKPRDILISPTSYKSGIGVTVRDPFDPAWVQQTSIIRKSRASEEDKRVLANVEIDSSLLADDFFDYRMVL